MIYSVMMALYGLKQDSCQWFQCLQDCLASLKFNCSFVDPFFFVYTIHVFIMMVVAYVDDILVTGNFNNKVEVFLNKVRKKIDVKGDGELSQLLGITIPDDALFLKLDHRRVIERILNNFNMADCHPVHCSALPWTVL